jgi:hypothetical protein
VSGRIRAAAVASALASALACAISEGRASEGQGNDESPPRPIALHRLELRPFSGWAWLPGSLTGAFLGLGSTFRASHNWALGLDGAWYEPFNAAHATSSTYPLTEASWSATVDVAYLPFVATPTREGEYLGSFEAWADVGAGLMSTRPVPLLDPIHRHFDYRKSVHLAAGIGARVFVTRSVAVTLDLRDLLFFEDLEDPIVAGGSPSLPPTDLNSPSNPDTSYSNNHVTNAIELRLGASFFVF